MKKTKFLLFTLIAVFIIGFAFNVNALEVSKDLTLTEDVNEEIVIPSGKIVTLNLGGKTVTASSGKVAITNNGILTIEGEGSVIASEGNYAVLNHGSKLVINGGTYSKENVDSHASLISNGWYKASENTSGDYSEMIINGGSFNGGSYTTIKNDSFGKMTINDGKFVSDMRDAGIQEAGSSITINGGTFDAVVYLMNWSSVDQEEKVVAINGGTFNKVVNIAATNEENVAKASKVSVSIGDKPTFNSNLYISNSGAAEGTNPIIIDKLAVKTIKGTLTIGARSADSKMPAVTLDGMTVGGSIILNHLKPSIIKNTTVNGSEIKAFNVTLENVTAKAYTPATKDGTVTIGVGTEIGKVNATANAGNTIIVDGGKVNTILSTGKNKSFGNDSIIIKSGSVSLIETSKGNVNVNGGKVDKITIDNKYVTTNPVTVTVKDGATVDVIDNQRAGNESATVETKIILPENYQLAEDGVVQYSIEDANVLGITNPAFYTGEAIIPNITVEVQKVIDGKTSKITLVKDTDYEVTFANNTEKGTATVTIKGIGAYFGTIEKTFEITDKKAIDDLVIADFVDKIYDGESKKQLIKIYDGDTQLVFGTDYRVINKDNVNAGTATVIITGKGKYTGKIEKTYKIKPANIVSSVAEGIVNKVYLGKPLTQSNLVLKRNGMTLVLGKDYKVSYEKNNAVGRAMVVVHGIGNYSGIKMKGFNIVPKRTSISGFTTYGNSITVSYKSVPGNVKYQIAYKQNGNRTYKYEKTSDTKLKARFLKYNMKYFFKVRPYKVVNGRTYYGAWSDVKTKTIVR